MQAYYQQQQQQRQQPFGGGGGLGGVGGGNTGAGSLAPGSAGSLSLSLQQQQQAVSTGRGILFSSLSGSAVPSTGSIPAAAAAAAGAGIGGGSGSGYFGGVGSAVGSSSGTSQPTGDSYEKEKVFQLVQELISPETREEALLELSKKREAVPELAIIMWHSFGVMSALLQEIVSIYPLLSPPSLTAHASNRVCNALALLQTVASHNDTRPLFLNAHIPLFLYPFLNTVSKTRPFEYLRLTSLGVIGALVKNDSSEVVHFLLTSEIIPLCLRIMETGSELSKTVAIFIVQKILMDDMGLQFVCQTYERFLAVANVLSTMVSQLVEHQSMRLLKHVVRCYLRLSENVRARDALRQCLPDSLRDNTFSNALKDDGTTKRWLAQLNEHLLPQHA